MIRRKGMNVRIHVILQSIDGHPICISSGSIWEHPISDIFVFCE